jgi:hypothetical protein
LLSKGFSAEEDRFLICECYRVGYGQWEQIRENISKSPMQRFNYFFRSRTAAELSRRIDQLIKHMEKGRYYQQTYFSPPQMYYYPSAPAPTHHYPEDPYYSMDQPTLKSRKLQ